MRKKQNTASEMCDFLVIRVPERQTRLERRMSKDRRTAGNLRYPNYKVRTKKAKGRRKKVNYVQKELIIKKKESLQQNRIFDGNSIKEHITYNSF